MMIGHRSTIPILRFRAGPLSVGIAAEDVLGVMSIREDVPHIATLFGVEPGDPGQVSQSAQSAPSAKATGDDAAQDLEHRVIYVHGEGTEGFAFAADGPVQVVRCSIEDVLPMAPGISLTCWKPVMGFARIDGQTLVLLDIRGIADELRASGQLRDHNPTGHAR